jgi:hypothetical protein
MQSFSMADDNSGNTVVLRKITGLLNIALLYEIPS